MLININSLLKTLNILSISVDIEVSPGLFVNLSEATHETHCLQLDSESVKVKIKVKLKGDVNMRERNPLFTTGQWKC